jgi:hypothetical protein
VSGSAGYDVRRIGIDPAAFDAFYREHIDPVEPGTVDWRIQDANVETAIGPVEPCVLEDDVTNPIRPWMHDGAVWYEFRMPGEDHR